MRSLLPVASVSPAGAQSSAYTSSAWPASVWSATGLAAALAPPTAGGPLVPRAAEMDQIFTVESLDAEAM